jgi:hypothetical protein
MEKERQMFRQDKLIPTAWNHASPLAIAVCSIALAGCSGSQPYSSPVSASAASTFDCVRSQMVQLGYSIDEADRERGTVVGSLGIAMEAETETALVLSAEVERIDTSSKLSIKPYRQTTNIGGDVDRASDRSAEADAQKLLISCGGRVDQGEPDRPYGVRPEITTTP